MRLNIFYRKVRKEDTQGTQRIKRVQNSSLWSSTGNFSKNKSEIPFYRHLGQVLCAAFKFSGQQRF
ncbi:MAG: hypothetical protein LBS01_07610 [Prevotellaceae bacterium]|nr:hypothetical protein [Prevotellaceae bacterium]